MGKKVLVILYTFPPFPGVGGRRWAKFSRYLAEKGYEVHVICAENPFKEESLWIKDVEHANIKVHRLPVKYPRVMLHGVSNLRDKLVYRFWKIYMSFYSGGVIYERTMFWKKQLIKAASQVIKEESITNVIVSIPPYRLASYSVELKRKFPGLNFIVDYRDPWTDNKSFHGFENISPSRFKYEQKLETEVIDAADYIISVSDKMTEDLKAKNRQSAKIVTIPNGYDPADVLSDGSSTEYKGEKIRFVYGGTLYNDLEYVIEPLIKYLDRLKKTNKVLYDKLSFEFYGRLNKELQGKLQLSGNECISINDPVPLSEMQRIISQSSFGMLITPPGYSVVFNTKFCEYMANHKPILLFSYPGEAPDFIMSNKIGFHINPADIENGLDMFFANMPGIIAGFNRSFNTEPFSIPFLTTKIEKLLR